MTTSVVSLSRLMKRPTLAGMVDAQRLRQDDEEVRLPAAQADGLGGLDLPGRDGLQPAAHVLGHVGGREEGQAAHGPDDVVDAEPLGQEQRAA